MTISATEVRFSDGEMIVALSNDRTLGIPLAWYPRLLMASPEQRSEVRISAFGLHWEEIDEDISVEGLLAGRRDQTRAAKAAANS